MSYSPGHGLERTPERVAAMLTVRQKEWLDELIKVNESNLSVEIRNAIDLAIFAQTLFDPELDAS